MQKGKGRHIVISILLLAVPVLSVFAQPDSDSLSYEIAKSVYLRTCARGLKVLIVEDTTLSWVRMQLTVRGGTDRQTRQTEGIVQLQEAMFFNARFRGDTTVRDKLQMAGILTDVVNGIDYSAYRMSIGDQNWQEVLSLVIPCLRLPDYGQEEIDRTLSNIARVFQEAETLPYYYLEQAMNSALWGEQSARKNALGRFEMIYNAQTADLTRFHDRFYFPENCLLGITGPVNHKEVFSAVDTLYQFWEPAGAGAEPVLTFSQPKEIPYFFVENELAKVPLIRGGWVGPGLDRDPEGSLAAELFTHLMNRPGSRFQKKMVASGLALQANWEYQPAAPSCPVELVVIPDPRKIDQCMEALHKEIDQLATKKYFSGSELATAKQQLIYNRRYIRERSTDYLAWLSAAWAGGVLETSLDFTTTFGEFEKSQLTTFIRRYLHKQPFFMGMLVSSGDKEGLALETVFANPNFSPEPVDTGPPPPPFDLSPFRIQFEAGSLKPDFESRIMLSGIATKMKAFPESRLYVDGHTDAYGSANANLKLSTERAEAVAEYLAKFHKIDPERLVPRGFGESQPEVKERSEKDRRQNRRVVFTFITQEGGDT